jgi:NifU-like protein involved in Fe-S cluster formation
MIELVSFQASGCPATIATSSVATEMLRGLSMSEASQLTRSDYAEAVGGLPKSKQHCSVLAEAVVKQVAANLRFKDQLSRKDSS